MSYKVKIYYHHTDCGGVVYYATYLEFLEEARTDFLTAKGIDLKKLIQEGRFFVVARQEVDYRAPATYGDILEIITAVKEVSGVRINLEHAVKKQDGTVVIEACTTLAFVDKDFRPLVLPPEISNRIKN
jgi:acyl-CoA thioester hydrolase